MVLKPACPDKTKAGGDPGIDVRRFKPYPAYKDSSVEWLGKVPDNWEILKLKHIAAVNTLREYRTALISAAVTGKIDVREEVA